MKKIVLLLLFSINILGLSNLNLFAGSSDFELTTNNATLSIDRKGILKIIDKEKIVQISLPVNKLWQIVLKNKQDPKEYVFTSGKNFTIDKSDHILRIVLSNFFIGDKSVPVNAEFMISVKDDAFCFSGFVKCRSENWIIREIEYPCLPQIACNTKDVNIYWPNGLGMCYNGTEDFGEKSFFYPSGRGSMPWFSINSQHAGFYFGCHDPLQTPKRFNLSYNKAENAFSTAISTPVFDFEYEIPDIMVKIYNGEWYEASKYYRNWYDKHFSIASPSNWVINDSGWLLAILKQQNCEVMWPYTDLDKLCDVAERYNLNTIGLFGWAVGGHDHLYPNYSPDNLMGGKKALKEAIERAHKRGIKIILYANGKIMDASTDYYKYNGYQTIIMQENRRPFTHFFVKQKTATPVIFAEACNGSGLWRKTMFDLGMQAVSLGADGILYDQLGVLDPILCFSESHDHRPGQADSKYRLQMINDIREKVKELNSNFIVMTEATNDVVLRGIEYTHGWGKGTAPSENIFPSLYRFTFPELVTTQRNPNPMITRTDANFAAIYGLRHEVETRYPGDVKYLLKGSFTPDDYSNVNGPPDFVKMNSSPACKAEKYVHELIGFEKQNPEFFRHGKFIDEEGIKIQGGDIVAKGFLNGNRIGVVVWNKHLTEKRDFTVTVPGYQLLSASEPDNDVVSATSSLGANSLRLLIFQKN